jgi:hypothetical protein|tara:strand:+ start:72 stop:494 length:423 start_codon:yes stop_codon:yes gene_type:complete
LPTNKNKSNFDIDLDWGKVKEEEICSILEGNSKIEVKSEKGKWLKSGNIAVEVYRVYKSNNFKEYTGVMSSKSEWFVYNLVKNNENKRLIWIKTQDLKKLVINLYKRGQHQIRPMGDKDSKFTTYGMLIKINELFEASNI